MAHHFAVLFITAIIWGGCLAQFDDPTVRRLPGSDLIGVGIDIHTAELMLPVVDLTWQGREFDSPYDGKTYEIPYEIASILTPDTFRNESSEVFTTVEQFTTSKGRATGISLSLGNVFAFTATRETQKIRSTLNQKTHRFGIVDQTHIFYRLLLPPPFLLRLSPEANEHLKSLPPYSEATRDSWNEFFDSFGTHYVRAADLGGRARMEILHDIKRWMRNDTDYVKTQFGIKFSFGMTPATDFPWTAGPANDPTLGIPRGVPIPTTTPNTPSGGKRALPKVDVQTKPVDENAKRGFPISFSFYQVRETYRNQLEIDLVESYKNSIFLQGGKPTQFAPAMWREWVATVPGNPTMVEYELASIAELISDESLRSQMEAAIADRVNSPRK